MAALAGCSDDGDGAADSSNSASNTPSSSSTTSAGSTASASTSASSSPEDAVETAYRAYTKAFLTGDGATAYAMLSERCRGLYSEADFAAAAESAADLYGLVDYEVRDVKIDADGRATVDAEFPVEALNQGGGSEWIQESGSWRTDKCD